jgi:hypothetical protein
MQYHCPLLSPLEGKLWGLVRKGLQYTARPLLMIAGEMRVPECHADVLVPHQSLPRWQGDATHNQPTRKSMAQVIEGKIYHTCLAYCMHKRCAEGSVQFTRTSSKHRASNGYTHSNCLQRGGQHLIHRHATTLAILDIGCSHSKYSAVEVDVFPGQREQLRGTKPGVRSRNHQGPKLGAAVDKQSCFLFWCKNVHASIVLPRKAHLLHRILSGLVPGDGHHVQVLQKDQCTLDRHM